MLWPFRGFLFLMLTWSHLLHAAERSLSYPNGDVYTGEVRNGQPHGKGRMKYADGREYTGEWVHSQRQGYGEQTWKDNPTYVSYQGYWTRGLLEGTGTIAYRSGMVYSGDFKGAHLQGKGRMTYANGDVRFGNFVRNKREGEFVLLAADGRRYEEHFVNDRRVSSKQVKSAAKEKISNRGSFERLLDDYRIPTGLKVQSLADNTDLPRLGVEVGDVLQELCDVRLASNTDYMKADDILRTKQKPCTVKLLRKGLPLTLNDIR